MSFVSANITTDPTQLLDDAIAQINTTLAANGFPDWSGTDGDLAVIILQTIGVIAADVANVAATVLPAIFRAFGTQLLGIPYNQGTAASVLSTWTFTSAAPAAGYVIPVGTQVLVNGNAFYTQAQVTTAANVTSTTVLLIASQTGTAFNGLAGVNYVAQLNTEIDWVQSVTTVGLTSGGTNPQTDDDYQNELAAVLQLQAPRPIVSSDYQGMVLSDLAQNATSVTVGRATSVDAYYPDGRALSQGGNASAQIVSCTTLNGSTLVVLNTPSAAIAPTAGATVTGAGIPGSTTIASSPAPNDEIFYLSNAATSTSASALLTIGSETGYGPTHLTCTGTVASGSVAVTNMTGPYYASVPDVGARVVGVGIQAGTTVAATPAPGSAGFSMTYPATSANAGETLTVSSWTNVARCVTTFVTDSNGNALTPTQMDSLQTWLAGYREATFLEFVTLPSYNTIYVNAQVHVLPGFSSTAVQAQCVSAVQSYLSPATWGSTDQQATSSWLNFTQGFGVVRYNSIVGVLEAVPGCQYVFPGSGGLAIGTTPNPTGTTDLTLIGPAPLPSAGVVNITTA